VKDRRCPSCGGLVTADAEWCSQCFARLDGPATGTPEGRSPTAPPERPAVVSEGERPPPAEPTGAKPSGPSGVRVVEGNRVVWDCPACGRQNDLDTDPCPTCGTAFGRVWQEPESPPRISQDRAMALSLVFPGVGHVAAGRVAEGLARAVVFAFTIGMVVAILGAAGGVGGPLLPLVVLFVGASATLYLATAVDARRAVAKEPPVLSTRMLLIGATVLLLVAMAVLLIGGSGAV
jgi:RNA polymerase subunit RPABC4/transcription elongation factor Spt4